MNLSDALREAQGRGLDLVEVAPTAAPPVCKIVALGKFRYDISKQEKDKKPSGTKLKEIKRSEEHTSELQSHVNLVCRLLLEKKKPKEFTLPRKLPNVSPS